MLTERNDDRKFPEFCTAAEVPKSLSGYQVFGQMVSTLSEQLLFPAGFMSYRRDEDVNVVGDVVLRREARAFSGQELRLTGG